MGRAKAGTSGDGATPDRPRHLYLIVGNGGRYAALYCCREGLGGRINRGQSYYWPADYEAFVLGVAAEIVPTGMVGLIRELKGSVLDGLRGLPPGEPTGVLSLDLPGTKGGHVRRKKGGPRS